MRDILRGSVILTSGNLIVRMLSYLYRIVAGRMLTPYEFGILNLALPLQYMIVLLSSSGIAPTISKFVSEYEAKGDFKKRDEVVSSSLVFYFLLGVFAGAIFYFAAPYVGLIFDEAGVILPLRIASIALPFGMLVAAYTGVFQGFKRMEYMGITLVVEQLLRIFFAVLLLSTGLTAVNAIAGSSIGFVVAVPVAYLLFRRMGLVLTGYSFKEFKKILCFSLPVTATALASFVLAYVDILLIGYFLSANEVGIYSAASPTSRLVMAFSTALYAVMLPSVSEVTAGKDIVKLKEYVKYAYRLSGAVLLPATVISVIFSEFIITLLFGDAYSAAAAPFRILVVGSAFLGIFTLNSGIFQGVGRPDIPMKILLAAAVLDIALNLALIPEFKIMGAALASTSSFVFAGLASFALLGPHLNSINRERP